MLARSVTGGYSYPDVSPILSRLSCGHGNRTNDFWIDERATHWRIATQCIQLLSANSLKKDICDLQRPGAAVSEIDQKTIDACLPPEVQYACLYWVFHLEQSKARIYDGDQIQTFLKTHFLHWLEALCLTGKAYESIGLLEALQKIVQVRNSTFTLHITANLLAWNDYRGLPSRRGSIYSKLHSNCYYPPSAALFISYRLLSKKQRT